MCAIIEIGSDEARSRGMVMAEGARLPDSITVPVDLLFAQGVGDATLLTMLRLMALCQPDGWTPLLLPDELAAVLGCSRTTLYRHLRFLMGLPGDEQSQGLGWAEVRAQKGGLSVRPIWSAPSSAGVDRPAEVPPAAAGIDPPDAERRRALAGMGIVEPKLSFLAKLDLDLTWIEGWARWMQGHGWRFRNPQGYIIRQLEALRPPPSQYLDPAAEPWADWEPAEDEAPEEDWDAGEAEDAESEAATDPFLADAREIWQGWLKTAQAVVGRGTVERYAAGAAVQEAGPDHLLIGAVDEGAVGWLEQYAGASLRRAWRERTGRQGDVTFVVQTCAAGRGSPSAARGADEPPGAGPRSTPS